jgi:hypothetical protein
MAKKGRTRCLGIACLLVLGGVLLAGCGSGLQKEAQQQAKEFFGNGHVKILRIEKVQDAGGTRLAVVTIEWHLKPTGSCGLGPCRKPPRTSYAWLDFSLSDPKALRGYGMTTASQLAAINTAKSAKPVFSIFPDFTNPSIRCAIPRGNASGTITGGCLTLFDTGITDTNAHIRSVKFRERWPFAKTRDGHWPRGSKVGGWIVSFDRNSHVQSIRVFGDLPPQLWK